VEVAKKASSGKSGRSPAGKASGARSTKSARKTAKKPAKKTAKEAVKAARKAAEKPAKKAKARTSRAKLKSPLTRPQLRKFRQVLLEKRRDLVGDMSAIEASALRKNGHGNSGDLSSLPTHPADIGTDNYEQEFTLGLLESERALLEEIDAAIGRIEAGTFGICLGTGEAIGVARLKARPWAKYCIDYARMLEKGLVRRDDDRESAIASGTVHQSASDLDDDAGEE
jgi:DnaK suppressor protein